MALCVARLKSPRWRLSFSECALVYGFLDPDQERRDAAQLPRERFDERDRPAAADAHRLFP